MPKEIEVEFPVIVTLTLPDGHGMLAEEIADTAWQVVSRMCSVCIKEDAAGKPIEFASAYTEILTDETLVNGEALHPVEGVE